MDYIITFFIGAVAGFTAGLLVYRKHSDKLRAVEQKARDAADALR